jgi:hypothetical protein
MIESKKSIRVFQGLAGSPLATTEPANTPPAQPLTGAQRQALLRKRRSQSRLNAKLTVQRGFEEKTAVAVREAAFEAAVNDLTNQSWDSSDEFDEQMSALIESFYPPNKSKKVGISRGSVMTDAPRGLGRLITGGYGMKKIADVSAVVRANHGGVEPWHGEGGSRRARAEGNGPDHDVDQKGEQKKIFRVGLGEESEKYTLSEKQLELERLIKKNTEISIQLKTEEQRLAEEFLARIDEGPIRNENKVTIQRNLHLISQEYFYYPRTGINVYSAKPHAWSSPSCFSAWNRRQSKGVTPQVVENKEMDASSTIDEETSLPASQAAD